MICATHRDLAALVAAGGFREDLYFRLGGARFELPPLRERSDRLALIRRILDEETAHCGVRIELGEAALNACSAIAGRAMSASCGMCCATPARCAAAPPCNSPTFRQSCVAKAGHRPVRARAAAVRSATPCSTPSCGIAGNPWPRRGTGYLASDPVSAGAPAWHPHAGPGGRLRCAGGRRSRQARKIKTSLEPCPVNAGGLSCSVPGSGATRSVAPRQEPTEETHARPAPASPQSDRGVRPMPLALLLAMGAFSLSLSISPVR